MFSVAVSCFTSMAFVAAFGCSSSRFACAATRFKSIPAGIGIIACAAVWGLGVAAGGGGSQAQSRAWLAIACYWVHVMPGLGTSELVPQKSRRGCVAVWRLFWLKNTYYIVSMHELPGGRARVVKVVSQ